MVAAGIISAGTSIIGSFIGGSRAKKAAREARAEKKRLAAELKTLEENRDPIVNPYANVTNLSGLATDVSGMATNQFANLGVATQAAEMQAEQADIALANSLDTIRSTGAGAGGATALAQAALQSKKGISASIEQQEAQNEKLRAQGEERVEGIRMSEAQRLQGIGLSEGQRMQQSEAQGSIFTQNMNEARQNAEIDRVAQQMSMAAQAQAQANADQTNAITSGISAVGAIGSAFMSAKAKMPPTTPSDRRLKNNIKLISKSNSGLNIYSFEYINKNFGEGVYQGVMSDEIPKEAIIKHKDGFDRVDYSKLDVEFKLI